MLSFQRMGESNSILRQSSASFLAMEKLLKDTSSTILTNVECSITEMVFNETAVELRRSKVQVVPANHFMI